MSFLDRIFGARTPEPEPVPRAAPRSDDERAVERYRYLLETAPPATIEQVHAEAFAKLTPEQRQLVFQQLTATAPAGEAPADDRAPTLAQAATRAELRQPGTMERAFQGGGQQGGPAGRGAPGFGSMLGASLLGTVAGYVVGSALVSAFLPPMDGMTDAGGADAGDAGADGGADAGADAGGDVGGADAGGFDGGGFDGGGFDAGGFGDFGF
ncbi:hypothetical protein OVN18_09345 [Microcella daejeonensis]|uniref:DUF2076 domain-containing protein n=1 Tax=Microcella daejeonensis TaxID=2994971 RepID=A0A9E8MJL2_9MICO|nr:hypothetical protein [Microcella daejeonensis]WAB80770.1 hypothetical protein OVN18_09345 [Microcella daejeonensis]